MSKSVVVVDDQETSVRRQYRDHQGVDTEEFIRQTIQKHPKDRNFIMALEREMLAFIVNNDRPFYAFSPMSSYQRMLVHRVAAYFGLDHNVDQTGQIVIISRTKRTRVPETSFKDFVVVPEDDPANELLECSSAHSTTTIFRPSKPTNGYKNGLVVYAAASSGEKTSEDEERVFENRKYRLDKNAAEHSFLRSRRSLPVNAGSNGFPQLISSSSVRPLHGSYLEMLASGMERLSIGQSDTNGPAPNMIGNLHLANFYAYNQLNGHPLIYGPTSPTASPSANFRWPPPPTSRLLSPFLIPTAFPFPPTDLTVIAVEIVSGLPLDQTVYVGRSMVAGVFGQWALKVLFFGTVDGPVTDLSQLCNVRVFVLLCRPFSFNLVCTILGCSTPGGLPAPSGLYITPCIDQDMITRIVQQRSTLPTYNYFVPVEPLPTPAANEVAAIATTTTTTTDDTDTSTNADSKIEVAAVNNSSTALVQPSNG